MHFDASDLPRIRGAVSYSHGTQSVSSAALALVNAYGGDIPPWLRDEVGALMHAIDMESGA